MNNIYTNQFDSLGEMGKFPEKYKLPKLTQKEVQKSEQFSIYLKLTIKPIIMPSQCIL